MDYQRGFLGVCGYFRDFGCGILKNCLKTISEFLRIFSRNLRAGFLEEYIQGL